jgi:hypothetical protein
VNWDRQRTGADDAPVWQQPQLAWQATWQASLTTPAPTRTWRGSGSRHTWWLYHGQLYTARIPVGCWVPAAAGFCLRTGFLQVCEGIAQGLHLNLCHVEQQAYERMGGWMEGCEGGDCM